ncbi:MAG: hypothetical protein ACFFDN_28305 [Candidatus Hodarchaeota archaeon]
MKVEDIEKGIELAVELLNKNPKIQIDIEEEPIFIRRIVGNFKTKKGKDCKVIAFIGAYDDIKDVRIYSRGVKNWALIRQIPYDDHESVIKGPGVD